MGTRRQGREAALQILYQMEASGVSVQAAFQAYWNALSHDQDGKDFAEKLAMGCAENLKDIDVKIEQVSDHWRIDRMSRVDRNILRLATQELLYMNEIPARVTLNEAVELAKKFGSEGSASFVNGVLDKIADTRSGSDDVSV